MGWGGGGGAEGWGTVIFLFCACSRKRGFVVTNAHSFGVHCSIGGLEKERKFKVSEACARCVEITAVLIYLFR